MGESGSPSRVFPDWIDRFAAFASDPDLPFIYTQWTAISAVAAVLERRVWTHLKPEPLFPNLYVMLVGPPGGGKSTAVNRAKAVVRQVRNDRQRLVKFAPDDITKAGLVDAFKTALVIETIGSEGISEQSPVYMALDEMSTSISFMSGEIMTFLSKMFDADPSFLEQRRGKGDKALVIPFPIMNLLAGVQPGYLAQTVPEHAWEQGFLARFIMVYAEANPRRHAFSDGGYSSIAEDGLRRDLDQIFRLEGLCQFSGEGRDALEGLNEEGLVPVPDHEQLSNYVQRRLMFVAKLATISACSGGNSMIITAKDVLRARDWLLAAEATMPAIFKHMRGQSDDMVLNEAYRAIAEEYYKRGTPVPTTFLWQIFSRRAKAQQLKNLFQAAIHRGDYLQGDETSGWNSIIPARGLADD